MNIKSNKKRGGCCAISHHSLCVESLVIALTLISALAITGDMLITFRYITVTETTVNATDTTTSDSAVPLKENDDVMDILHIVLPYTTLAIAGLFVLEVFIKVCYFRARYLKQPLQVVDCLIAGATLGVEIAYYMEVFPYATLRAVSYIVLLRLWRLPSVCRIRAQEVRSELEDEIEILRCGRQRTEDGCSWLEGNLTHQLDTMKRSASQKESLKRQSFRDNENIVTDDGRCILRGCAPASPQIVPFSEQGSGRQNKYNSRGWKRTNSGVKTYIEMLQFKSQIRTSQRRERSESTISTPFNQYKTKDNPKDGQEESLAQQVKPLSVTRKMSNNEVMDEVFLKRGSLSEGSYTFQRASFPDQVTRIRPRNRRSSTSEYIDYSCLNSPIKEISVSEDVRKSTSCPSFDIDTKHNEIELRQSSDIKFEDTEREDIDKSVKKTDSSSSGTSSGISADASPNSEERVNKKELKRLTSCPEFVYTQRMGITRDDSVLIEEGHTIEDPNIYDNMGFLSDEDTYSIIMAEFDGSKTYRNEEGIPITSL